ncbi:MAG TPA: Ig-like domain-containing protein [Chryseolinea sp.]|nr:Ig-like domain-containing protein [Chryseolinea sp.]
MRKKLGLAVFCISMFHPFGAQSGESLPSNNPPVAQTDVFTMVEDTQLTGNVLTNDQDPDGDALHVTAGSFNTAHGSVVFQTDGTFTYTPNVSFMGFDTFQYQLCDDGNPSACCHGTVEITVQCKNDIPVANPDSYTTDEDTKLEVTAANSILKNDTDTKGDPLKATLINTTQHGTLVLNPDGTFTYTPNLNYYGQDTFKYVANDGRDNSNEAVVTITVLPVNDPPIAAPDVATTNEDVAIAIPVLANDTDVDDVLKGSMVIIVSIPTHGTAVVNTSTGKVTYTPSVNYYGSDSFTYKLKDSGGAFSNVVTVAITVIPVNDAPIASPDQATTPEDVPVNIPVLANDTDVDNAIDVTSVAVKTNPVNGTVAVQPDGSINYTPNKDYYGTDTFTYTVKDVGGATSAPGTVTIIVTPVNDPPIAVPDVAITDEDVAIAIPVLANDTDVDNVLTGSMIVIVNKPTHGTAVVNTSTGKVTYTPALNYYGSDSFTYKLKDSAGALSNVVTVAITVNPVNDVPFAAPDQATTPEDVPVNIPVLDNDTDPDNAIDVTSVTVKTNPANGTVAVQPDGSFQYTPNKDYYGTDTFTYTVTDVGGATSAPGTVTIVVTPVNDAPVAVNDAATTNENTAVGIPVLANDFDVDSPIDPSSITIGTNVQHGTISINTTTGIVTYTPANDYVGGDSFTYTIKDSGGLLSNVATVSISVINVNRVPVAVDDQVTLTTVSPVSIDVLANDYDPDGDELTIVSVTNPAKGSVKIENGEIIFTPEGTTAFTTSFSYTISDPGGLTDDAIVTINYSILELIVSQGFSPNGDGNNDTWYIKGIESYPNNIVKVFDRWGIQVYQKSGYENTIAPWNGRGNVGQMNGVLVERGTYFYILEPGNGMKRLEGYVVVIR